MNRYGGKPPRHGVARVISKLGMASRAEAARWVAEGRVQVNDRRVDDPEFPVRQGLDRVTVAGIETPASRTVLMLNKPRGLVTSVSDEQGRPTVYACLQEARLPWLAPVGRLDKASEGLLLFTNDPAWAARVSAPGRCRKVYHVQVEGLPDPGQLVQMRTGVEVDGEHLAAAGAELLRSGGKNAWLAIELEEGRNRQIRRLLLAMGFTVTRLVRVAIGSLQLGELAKGEWRLLEPAEIDALA